MSVDDPHGFSDRLQRLLTEDIPALDNVNDKRVLRKYIKKLRKKQSEGTVYNNAMRVQTLAQHLDTPFVDATEGEIEEVIDKLSRERDWSDGTERNYGKAVRAVIDKLQDKTKIDWGFVAEPEYIELTAADAQSKITEEDVFDREQVRVMVEEAARNERDRVLLGLLLDLGLRIAAICTLRIQDYEYLQEDGVGTIQLNDDAVGTKGAEGKVHVTTWSTPYLERYVSGDHPRPNDDDAPLLHKQKWSEDDPEDDGSLSPPVVRRRLRRITEDFEEIPDDKVNPHTFRHTAVTLWAKRGLSDREIVHRAGWSRESGQLERYEHLTDKDINDEILREHGIEPSEDATPLLADCPQCGAKVEPVMTYCARCGQNLDIVREHPQWFRDIRAALGDDDDLIEYFLEHPHQIKADQHDLPVRLHSRLQKRLQEHTDETGKAAVGESFIDGRATEEEALRQLAENSDDFELPEQFQGDEEDNVPDGNVEFQIRDKTEGTLTVVEVPAEEVYDILDDIADIERITDTEYVVYDDDGSAIRILSILEEETMDIDDE